MTDFSSDPVETREQEPPFPGKPDVKARSGAVFGFLVSGWKGFSLWLAVFVVWLAFLGYQVIRQRPEPSKVQGEQTSLPSRGQLTVSEAVWVVRVGPNGALSVPRVIAGLKPGQENGNQLVILDLESAVTEVFGNTAQPPGGESWLVPVIKMPNDAKSSENQKETWRVAPLPADPARPKGGPGKVYPLTRFNEELMQSWWTKHH